jgi:hypothetical protein
VALIPSGPRTASFQSPTLCLGIVLGICFSGIGLTWLLLANRVSYLDQFASERNIAVAIAFGLLGLAPICRFRKSPWRSFLCGITAWAIFTGTYLLMELHFPRLATRLSAFHSFVLGSIIFGLLATLAWVTNVIVTLRRVGRQPIGFKPKVMAPGGLPRPSASEILDM